MTNLPLGFEIARDIVSQYANSDVYFAGVGPKGSVPKEDNLELCIETFLVLTFQLNFALTLTKAPAVRDQKISNLLHQGEGVIVQYAQQLGFNKSEESLIRASFVKAQWTRFKEYDALGRDAFQGCRLKYYERLATIVGKNPSASVQSALVNADGLIVQIGGNIVNSHQSFLE